MARTDEIYILTPYHRVGIGVCPSMKDRIRANRKRICCTYPVTGKGKRILKVKLPLLQLSLLKRCVNAELKTVQTVSAGTLPGIGQRVLSKNALNDSARRRRGIRQQVCKVPIREAV